MVWYSRRVSLTALLQINGHLQRDVVSLRKSQRKATKLKKKDGEVDHWGNLKVESSVWGGDSVLEHVRCGRVAVKPLPNLAALYT